MEEHRPFPWQLAVLNRTSLLLGIFALIWGLIFLQASATPFFTFFALAGCALPALRALPYRVRSVTLASSLLFISFLAAATRGSTPGALLGGLGGIVIAGVFLGVRAAFVFWLLSALSLAAGLAVLGRSAEPTAVALAYNNPRLPEVAFRQVSSYLAISSVIAGGVSAIIYQLSSALKRAETALQEARDAGARELQAAEAKESAMLRLVEAQKFEVLAQLSASVAHDFNNSLQVIMASASFMTTSTKPDEIAVCAEEILEACNDSSQVARQLLTLGQRVILEPRVLDLGTELQQTRRALNRLLPSNISVECDQAKGHHVYADRVQLKQALLNLAINASHAMPDGGTLSLLVETNDLGEHIVIVGDTGTGMDLETQRKIFDPFFTTKGTQGTGLGLATVRAIMDQHSGRVEVKSQPGQGSQFRLIFPTSEAPISETTESSVVVRSLKGKTILVADDDPRVRRAIMEMLSSAGASVLGAVNGNQALQLFTEHQGTIDVLCTDAVMPKMPTRDLILAVRERFPATGILVCSAYVESELLRRGIEMRAVAHLAKPFSAEQLLSKVGHVLTTQADQARVAG